MIEFKIEDTQIRNLKTAVIYPENDIKDLFVAFDIYESKTEDIFVKITIQVPEKFIRQMSEKTGVEILDLSSQGVTPDYNKYLELRLYKNITLLHSELK